MTFEARDPENQEIGRNAIPLLVLTAPYVFYPILLHVPLLFRGIFPFFGAFLFNLQGILRINASVALLLCLGWGTFNSRVWACGGK